MVIKYSTPPGPSATAKYLQFFKLLIKPALFGGIGFFQQLLLYVLNFLFGIKNRIHYIIFVGHKTTQ
ncbi:MAG TPA: hypothetical protein DEF34_08250 [Desulfotomaculum sp.]|nr:MAG: hypothetical protein VR67_09965 [Peptococcaceae bacterium BRH_c8a]KJS71341.1 MAG: hypothetical protein JL56_15235 [Desulfotomaculum sp. BICA1-6]HBX23604.1 hypothetical protein [Desulfotomaculum sp.]